MQRNEPNVLLVHDDPVMLSMHKRSLEMLLGCDVLTFETGLAALRHLSEVGVGVVVSGEEMPDMTAATFVRTLRHHPRLAGIAVIVLAEGEKTGLFISAGANSVLPRRIAPLVLAREAQQMLQAYRPESA